RALGTILAAARAAEATAGHLFGPFAKLFLAQLPILVGVVFHGSIDKSFGTRSSAGSAGASLRRPGGGTVRSPFTPLAETGPQFLGGQLAVLVLVEALERGDRSLDLLGGNLAVAIG